VATRRDAVARTLIIIVVFAVLRARLSWERPGKMQHIFELMYDFFRGQSEDQVGIAVQVPGLFGTLFIFIRLPTCWASCLDSNPHMVPPFRWGASRHFLLQRRRQSRRTASSITAAHFAGPMPRSRR